MKQTLALAIVDMQKDFLEEEGKLTIWQKGLPTMDLKAAVAERIKNHDGPIIVSQDSHTANDTEFQLFPPHCIKGTEGWELSDEVEEALIGKHHTRIEKASFQGQEFVDKLLDFQREGYDFEFTGVCTHICIHDNATALFYRSKEILNQLPRITIRKNLVGDFDPDMASFALRRLKNLMNANII